MALTHEDQLAGGKARGIQQRQAIAQRAELAQIIEPIVAGLQREQVGPELIRMALSLAEAASDAEVEITNPYERKATAETAAILHKMARLELGESTSNQATFAVGDTATRRAELQARLSALDADTTTS